MKFKAATMRLMTAYFVFSFSSDPDTAPHNNTTEQTTRNKEKVLPATGIAFQSLTCAKRQFLLQPWWELENLEV